MRNPEELDATMEQLTALAWQRARGAMDAAAANKKRAELCQRHGPGLVHLLDELYEEKLVASGGTP